MSTTRAATAGILLGFGTLIVVPLLPINKELLDPVLLSGMGGGLMFLLWAAFRKED